MVQDYWLFAFCFFDTASPMPRTHIKDWMRELPRGFSPVPQKWALRLFFERQFF
jgi:hypothetical protein